MSHIKTVRRACIWYLLEQLSQDLLQTRIMNKAHSCRVTSIIFMQKVYHNDNTKNIDIQSRIKYHLKHRWCGAEARITLPTICAISFIIRITRNNNNNNDSHNSNNNQYYYNDMNYDRILVISIFSKLHIIFIRYNMWYSRRLHKEFSCFNSYI